MIIRGEVLMPADRATVWAKLNDAAVLQACIPGCHAVQKTSDTTFAASARMKIGPVTATLRGNVTLTEVDAPNRCRILGEGQGGLAGFARGGADVALVATEGGTMVCYDVQASLGGRLAQFGARLVDGAAKRTADTFFANFAAAVAT